MLPPLLEGLDIIRLVELSEDPRALDGDVGRSVGRAGDRRQGLNGEVTGEI